MLAATWLPCGPRARGKAGDPPISRRRPRASAGGPIAKPAARLQAVAFPAAVAILTVLAFLPALENDFVDWDDLINLRLNEAYRGLGWTQLKWMFTSVHTGHYIPLTWVTFGLDYLVWGLDPLGYHLTNLILHALNAV